MSEDQSARTEAFARDMRLVIISGMSGSGKSVALHALEDEGFYCVDNLPPELLLPLIEVARQHAYRLIGVAIDVRSGQTLQLLATQIAVLRRSGVPVTALFLDATTQTLVRRFSETRRRHPLTKFNSSDPDHDLQDAIQLEREQLADYRDAAHIIDTTMTRASQLRSHIRALISAPRSRLTLIFESFAFKRGVPVDADYVFDVRMLPNPHYEPDLRDQTGQDEAVARFLDQQPAVQLMYANIRDFLATWLPSMVSDHRSYVTVAIGCTGGQHRSVYLVERLYQEFSQHWVSVKRHREMDLL